MKWDYIFWYLINVKGHPKLIGKFTCPLLDYVRFERFKKGINKFNEELRRNEE